MSEKGKRMTALLKKAAKALEEGSDPFAGSFLADNNVTSDECVKLSSMMAAVLNGYVNAPKEIQHRILMAHAIEDTGIPFEFVDHAMKTQEVLGKLHDVSGKVSKKIKET